MLLTEKTVDVFVGDAGERRIEVVIVCGCNLFEHCGQLMRNLLTAEFHQSEAGTLVKDDHEQEPADYGDVNALFLAFVRERRKFFLSDQLSHSTRRRHVAGSEGCQTGCVKISHFALGCDFLTVLIDQKDHLGRGVHSQSRQDSLYLVVLLFTQQDWFCHCATLYIEGRGGIVSWRAKPETPVPRNCKFLKLKEVTYSVGAVSRGGLSLP